MNNRDLFFCGNKSIAHILSDIDERLVDIARDVDEGLKNIAVNVNHDEVLERQNVLLERIATSLEQIARGKKREREEGEEK